MNGKLNTERLSISEILDSEFEIGNFVFSFYFYSKRWARLIFEDADE